MRCIHHDGRVGTVQVRWGSYFTHVVFDGEPQESTQRTHSIRPIGPIEEQRLRPHLRATWGRAVRARQYQMRTIESVEGHLASGTTPLVVAPTGSGKTFMASRSLERRKRAVAVVHTNVLREQTAENIPTADVLTVQGLISRGPSGERRRRLLIESDIVWVDEAHHLAAGDWSQVSALLREHKVPTFMSTATPERADGSPMGDVADKMVVAANYSELISLGHLCQCDMAAPEIGRRKQAQLKVRPDGVASYLEHGRRKDGGGWRAGLHCETTIEECERAAERYREAGVRAEVVCMGTGNRNEIFARYTAGHLDMLCSPMALSEGFDSPRAKVLVSRRRMSCLSMYLQWGGRILRPWNEAVVERWAEHVRERYGLEMTDEARVPDMRALFIDCTGAREQHGHVTQDRQYSLDKGIEDAPEDEPEEKEPSEPREPPEKPEDIEVKYKMLRDTLVERYVELEAIATERGYAPGWVYHRMKDVGLEPPRAMTAKFKSVCRHCRKRLKLGEPMFWAGTGNVLHRDCWFDSLSRQQLEEAAQRVANGA